MDLNGKIVTRDGWSDIESNFFVERYNYYKNDVGKGKKFQNRKLLFNWIAGEMTDCLLSKKTEQQLTSRYYTLTRRSKKLATNVVNITQGTVVDMNEATVTDTDQIQFIHLENFFVDSNETSSTELNTTETDGVETEIETEQCVTKMDTTETCSIKTCATQTNATPDAIVDAIVRGVDHINKQIHLPSGQTRTSPSATVGIATIYSVAENGISSRFIDLTTSSENGSRGCSTSRAPSRDTVAFNLESSSNHTSTSSSSSCAALQSFPGISSNHALSTSSIEEAYLSRVTPVRAATSSSSDLTRNLSTAKKSKVSFTVEETKWLLDQYYTYMDEVGPMKLFRTKNLMWQTLASKMNVEFESTRTGEHLSKRVADVIELKKAAVIRNGVSGAVREMVEYEEELDKIAALDDSIEPEVMRGINYVKYKENSNKNDHDKKQQGKKPRWDKPNKKGILDSLSETMMEIEKRKSERDAAKEERDAAKEERRNENQKVLHELLRSLKKPEN